MEHPHRHPGEGALHQFGVFRHAGKAAVVPVDEGADEVSLPALVQVLFHIAKGPLALSRVDEVGLDLLPARGQLVQNGDVQVAVHHQRQGAGDGGGAHHQQVGGGALLGQCRALPHPEPVLLVGDDQPQVPELHLVPDEGVGADDQLDAAVGQRLVDLFLLRRLYRPGEQRHGDVGGLQQPGEGLVVLGGQDLRGGHQGRLGAALDHRPAQRRGHGGFAAAHIPLDQAVHGGVPGHVRHPLGDGPLLRPGEGKGQQLLKAAGVLVGDGVGVFRPSPFFDAHEPQLQQQKLLEDQPPPGGFQPLRRLGEVDVLQGKAQVAQLVLLPQPVGEGVVHRLRQQLQGVLHGRGDHPGGEPLGGGVDGHHRQSLALRQKLGGEHLPAQEGARHLPSEQVGLPLFQQGGDVPVVEEGEGQVRLPVGDGGLVQQLPAPHPVFRGFAQHGGPHHRHLLQHRVPDGGGLAPVLIGPGVQPQQVPHGGGPQLPVQGGAFFPHAFQFLDVHVEQRGHRAASFPAGNRCDNKETFLKRKVSCCVHMSGAAAHSTLMMK